MSVIIFKPRQYAPDFAFEPPSPSNGDVADAPYDKDTRVREVTRYTGSKTLKYADTGEFSITLLAGQAKAEDVKDGYLMLIDGDPFIIEAYTWSLTENGYECDVSGRDFGAYLDNAICTKYPNKDEAYNGSTDGKISIDDVTGLIARFFDGNTNPHSWDWNVEAPEHCGWFRDDERKGAAWYSTAFEDTSATGERRGSNVVQEVMSYGAILRTFCNWYGIGYRWRVEWNEASGLYSVGIELYNRADSSNVMIRSTMRGVSGFSYDYDARDSVNAVIHSASSQWYQPDPTGGYVQDEENKHAILGVSFDPGSAVNYAEVANSWRSKFVDLGDVPQESDATSADALKWISEQDITENYSKPTEKISFTYDNSGIFKYGEHFKMGSRVTIVDDFLGIGSDQQLTEVQTNYDAGEPKSYAFSFGDSTVTQADKLKRKFAEIDRRTYAPRKTS